MSAPHSAPSWKLPSMPPADAPRAKALPRRLHQLPDPDLEGLSSEERDLRRIWAKRRMSLLVLELESVVGHRFSNRRLAEFWLGSRSKEGTIRSWKDAEDLDRAPRKDDLARLELLTEKERALRAWAAVR